MANVERKAHVLWEGDLQSGSGRLTEESSRALEETSVTFAARVEQPGGRSWTPGEPDGGGRARAGEWLRGAGGVQPTRREGVSGEAQD